MSIRMKSIRATLFATLITLTATLTAGAAVAGQADNGSDWMLMQHQNLTQFQPNWYFGGAVGYAESDWDDFGYFKYLTDLFLAPTTDYSAASSGLIWGLFTGVQFRPHWAAELGGYSLFDGNQQLKTPPDSDILQQVFSDRTGSYFVYGALKAIVPIHKRFDIFAELGPVFRHIDHHMDCTVTTNGETADCATNPLDTSDGHYWSFIFSTGFEYALTPNIVAGARFIYVPSNDDGDTNDFDTDAAPAVYAGVATLSYKILNI